MDRRLIRILVVDDNTNHSAGIRQLIEMEPGMKVVGIATSGPEAIEKATKIDVDVVLMDMNMPDMDGITAIEKIHEEKPKAKILALTGYDDPDLVFRAMQSGGKGYILKTMVTSQLHQAINEVVQGKIFLPTTLATKFFDEFHVRKTKGATKPDPVRQALLSYLTNREKEVLALLTEGITYKGVAERLVISETTVKTHVNNIFQKLQVNDRTQAVLYAIKHGLIQTADSNESMKAAV
ncbi:MAG: response regulator transcription factor [Cyanobacteria bacterium HKST-UBA04]|nr:response regulator transcription factor [Cyanobacteria bacterium HKST-UBA04]MCA9840925.1 response regulator transcription factor [Cyanobacteria bacterium HKST-UBA03]